MTSQSLCFCPPTILSSYPVRTFSVHFMKRFGTGAMRLYPSHRIMASHAPGCVVRRHRTMSNAAAVASGVLLFSARRSAETMAGMSGPMTLQSAWIICLLPVSAMSRMGSVVSCAPSTKTGSHLAMSKSSSKGAPSIFHRRQSLPPMNDPLSLSAGSSDDLYRMLNSHSIRHGLAAIGGWGGSFRLWGPLQCTQNRSCWLGSTGRSFSLAAATVPARPVDVRWESASATLCDAVCALEDRRDPSDPPPLLVDAGPPRAVAVPPELLVWPAAPPVIVDVFVLFEAARWVEPLRGSSGDGEHKVRVRFTRHGTKGEKAPGMRFRCDTRRVSVRFRVGTRWPGERET